MSKREFDPALLLESKAKRKRSRWGAESEDKSILAGLPLTVPADLTKEQEQQYIVQVQIEEISRRLRTGDLGIPPNPEDRSPSPEPIYNNEGKRLNTREFRTRKKLEEMRHEFIQKAIELNPEYKPPQDYRPPSSKITDKVWIPQDDHPEINFVGLLIGPRGNTLKMLEKETGAKIIIRGKGSVKEGKIGRKDGLPMPGEDEPLHAYITATNVEHVKIAVEKIKEIIRQGIEVPEEDNDLRKQQLRELALLNGTLREGDALTKLRQLAESQAIITNTIICTICGGAGHISADCKQKRPGDSLRAMLNSEQPTIDDRAKMDTEYMSLMAELGQGPPPPKVDQQQQQQQQQQQSTMPLTRPPFPRPLALPPPRGPFPALTYPGRPPNGPPIPPGPMMGGPMVAPFGGFRPPPQGPQGPQGPGGMQSMQSNSGFGGPPFPPWQQPGNRPTPPWQTPLPPPPPLPFGILSPPPPPPSGFNSQSNTQLAGILDSKPPPPPP